MIGINITKFSSQTQHYYCRFYVVYSLHFLDKLRDGDADIEYFKNLKSSYFESFEKTLPDFKSNSEKDLMLQARKIVDDFYDKKDKMIWFVCYEGQYSASRTKFINNPKRTIDKHNK